MEPNFTLDNQQAHKSNRKTIKKYTLTSQRVEALHDRIAVHLANVHVGIVEAGFFN